MQSTGQSANIFDTLTELASRRVNSHFLAPTNKLPHGILSTLLISTIAKVDLASYLINAQIRKLLILLATASCGGAERGPFAPLVLAQPPDGTKEDQIRAKIAQRIQFCFHILNGVGVDRKLFLFFAAKISGLVKRSEEGIGKLKVKCPSRGTLYVNLSKIFACYYVFLYLSYFCNLKKITNVN